MTREGQGIGPEETPPPPASTRWSGSDAGDDQELLPPFVPGRRDRPAEPVADTAEAVTDTADVVNETTEVVADTAEPEPVLTPEPDAEAFPFDEPASDDQPFPWPESPGEAPEEAAATGQGVEPWPEEPEADLAELEQDTRADDRDGVDPALEVAGRLEELARRLRRDGARGVEAEMASSDRIVALLAGLIAGYLAGREG